MKRIVFAYVLIQLLLTGCQKEKNSPANDSSAKKEIDQTLAHSTEGEYSQDYYVELILNQSSTVEADYKKFSFVLEKFANNSFNIVKELHNQGGINLVNEWKDLITSQPSYSELSEFYSQNGLDTAQMLDEKAEILGSLASFYEATPEFYELEPSSQISILDSVFEVLKSEEYRNNNPDNPLVVTINNIIETFTNSGNLTARLTTDEVMGCLGNAIATTVASAWQLVSNFVSVINGTNLGWSGIKNLAKSFLRTLAGSHAITGIVTFGVCIAWEVFF